jgi:hypothetical protein
MQETAGRNQSPGMLFVSLAMDRGDVFKAQAAALQPRTLRIIFSAQTMSRAMQAGLRNGEIHLYFEKPRSHEPVQACISDWLDAQRGK